MYTRVYAYTYTFLTGQSWYKNMKIQPTFYIIITNKCTQHLMAGSPSCFGAPVETSTVLCSVQNQNTFATVDVYVYTYTRVGRIYVYAYAHIRIRVYMPLSTGKRG